MKNNIKLKIALILLTPFLHGNLFGQTQIFDVVSISSGYTNQAFYSMPYGEVSNVTNLDWELAFQISGFEASILINGKNNVHLFRSGLDVNAWSSVSANDTVGVLNLTNELFNQDTSWWAGAFNITNDTANQFDLGWGVYDLATHVVFGDSLYFLEMPNGDIKKLWIQALQNGVYSFVYADVDGSNEVNASLDKLDYTGKNFGYYSITNGTTIDREPNKYTWDITFCQYVATTPFVYKVTGVLFNDSVTGSKVYPVDVSTSSAWASSYSNYINTVGYYWKSYDFNLNAWAIEDSLVYYVNGRDGGLWKLVFTGFGGAATGEFEFYKEQVSSTGMQENGGKPAFLEMYPNPANDALHLTLFIDQISATNQVNIFDVEGRKVFGTTIHNQGLQTTTIPVNNLTAGLYVVRVTVGANTTSQKLVISE